MIFTEGIFQVINFFVELFNDAGDDRNNIFYVNIH